MHSRLAEISNIVYGKSPVEVADRDGSVPIIGTGGEYGRASRPMFDSGVVVPRKGSLGNPQLVLGPFWPTDTTFAVLPSGATDTRWLYYCLLNYDLSKLNEATGVPSISRDWLSKIRFFNPGQPRQSRIADILQTIDRAIEKTEALIEKYQQIKAGLMHDLFTRGIGADGQLRPPREQTPELYKKTPIGWIPKEWEFTSVGTYIESWAMGPRFSADEYTENGNVATLRTTDIDDDGTIDYNTMPIARLHLAGLTSHLLKHGDFVITRSGTCGVCAVFDRHSLPVLPGAFLIRFRFKAALSPYFAASYLNSDIGSRLVYRVAEGGVQKNLRGTSLIYVKLPIPSRQEQKIIQDKISEISAFIESECNQRGKLQKQKSGLMHDLLTGKVPVQVEPESEPEAAHV